MPSPPRAKREDIPALELWDLPLASLTGSSPTPERRGRAQGFPRAPRRPVHVSLAGGKRGLPRPRGDGASRTLSHQLLARLRGQGRASCRPQRTAPLAGWAPLSRLWAGDPRFPAVGRGWGIPAGLRGLPVSRKRERSCARPRREVSCPRRWNVFVAEIRSVGRWKYNVP